MLIKFMLVLKKVSKGMVNMSNIIVDVVDRKTPIQIQKKHDFSNATNNFHGQATPNEYYAFQIAVSSKDISSEVSLQYGDLTYNDSVINANNFFCINFGGTDYLGNSFVKRPYLEDGEFLVLWVSLFIPENASGNYTGNLTLCVNEIEYPLSINIAVSGEMLADHGDSEPWRFSRLRWLDTYDLKGLNKTTGKYTSLQFNKNIISILGRKIMLGENGLPVSIHSFFNKNIKITDNPIQIIDAIKLKITTKDGLLLNFNNFKIKTLKKNDSQIVLEVKAENELLFYRCKITAEFDGFIGFELELNAKTDIEFQDISLILPYTAECSKYFMGLGHTGGYRPETVNFKWDSTKRQNGFWMGGINGGLRCEFRGENYYPPLPLLYYKQRTITPPKSFSNNGKGGIVLHPTENYVNAVVYSGERLLNKNESLRFDFNLLVTPLKELDMKSRLSTRYVHGGDVGNVALAKSVRATHINVHHCNEYNPYINYPFIANEKLKSLIDNAHSEDIKVKVYYTIREQSDHTVELQAFRSLGDEIFMKPSKDTSTSQWNSEGLSWFAENIGTDIIPAWKSVMDASINLNGRSRFANYWVEGLRWLLEKQDIDGIYIDDTVIERDTLKRARVLLDEKNNCLVDLHTCNHFSKSNGYGNNANMYMELMPYIDTLWIGESFDYNKKPDFWLVEICGTPYGLSGEMLQDNGNPYRGMLFGITTRYPKDSNALVELWKFIIEYKLEDTEFWGFWNDQTPVKSDTDDIYCSLYKSENRLIIAVASWNDKNCDVKITLENYDIQDYKIYTPEIKYFQEHTLLDNLNINIESAKGKIIVLEK